MGGDIWKETPDIDTHPFELLSDETRQEILGNAAASMEAFDGTTFSEIRRLSGVEDPGRFRYHVDKLLGAMLTREDDKYRIRYGTAGLAIALGSCDPNDAAVDWSAEASTEYSCPYCDSELAARYRDEELLSLVCPTHSVVFTQPIAPVLDSERPAEWVDAAVRRMHRDVERLDSGRCPWCQGGMESILRRGRFTYDATVEEPEDETPLWARHVCEECPYEFWYPAGLYATVDHEVRAFFTRHGIDVRNRPSPHRHVETVDVIEEGEAERVAAARLRYAVDGDRLNVRMDATASVTRVGDGADT